MSSLWSSPVFDLNKFVDLVSQEKFTLDLPLRHIFSDIFREETLKKELRQAHDYSRKVEICTQVFPFWKLQSILRSIDPVLSKNNRIMELLENNADEYEVFGNNEKALQFYTLALCFVPTDDGTTLFEIYTKRAAILVRMGKFDFSLKDLDMALRYGETEALKVQLLEEKDACEAMIIPKVMGEEDLMREKYLKKVISQVNGEELNQITVLPNFISVKYHPDKGRYLVTDIDLEPGTTVLVEEPFVCLPEGQLKWQTKLCSHCLKETLNPIPCDQCVFCIYCDEDCRSKDYEHGHIYECPILPYAHSMKFTTTDHLAVKAICKGGPLILKELFDKSYNVSQLKDDFFVPTDATSEDSDKFRYIQFLSMASHDRPSDMPYTALLAISVAHTLRIKTSFFDTIQEFEIPDFENFIATVFIHHSQSLPYNTVSLTATQVEIPDVKTYLENLDGRRETQTAVGVYPIVNLLNHSCAATTFRQHLARGRVAIVTNRHLKKGDELTHGYGFGYQRMSIRNRRKGLAQFYHFHCECIACKQNWPLITEMDASKMFTSVCGPCENHVMDLLSKYHITDIRDDLFKSEYCTAMSETNPLKQSVPCNPFSLILGIGIRLVLQNRPIEAVPILRESIKYFQNNPGQPTMQLIQAQSTLVDAYDLISNTVIEPQVIPVKKEESGKEVPDASLGYYCCIT